MKLESVQIEVTPGCTEVTRLYFSDSSPMPSVELKYAEMHRQDMPFQRHYAAILRKYGRLLAKN